ncbi:CheB methylesterase domain-containing protein [Bacillus tuaregi]|uniref:CheB methylesterase domain-containing protein n=1 Tax=Bacillus tuaregi TaxID=1816695 RepID=UPI0008F883C0|nr:CheB methylesterase domain-containing protein [Bacillus tuaregi]
MKAGIIKSLERKKTTNLYEKYSKIELNNSKITTNWNQLTKKIILMGSSTGGPSALQTVLCSLPENITAPIVIVQHMPSGFTRSLANRLNALADITVKEAEEGDVLEDGTAYIAPGGCQLRINQFGKQVAVQLDHTTTSYTHCPSVDLMFSSASELAEYGKIVVIMTGMGSDGSSGLITLKRSGHVKAIAESEESCVVYGMPRAAIATELVDEVVNVEHIAKTILKYL